jgi:hypothetical protein
MPYGIDKKHGGDSPENVKKMERCVSGISDTNKRTGKPYTKSEKIAICKSRLFKKKSEAEAIAELLNKIDELKKQFYDEALAYTDEYADFLVTKWLIENNYEL